MAKETKLEWVHHTFNPWWGCVKLSPACKNCYAEAWAKRVGSRVWGDDAERRFFSDKHWAEPLRWNRDAEAAGERRRVFCASMADVFERRSELDPWRAKLAGLIEATPQLDWLLLTKRHDLVQQLAPWREWPANVWLGMTVENQEWARQRIPRLIEIPAVVRFLSCEPLLSPLDLSRWLGDSIHWIVAGGESGAKARPTHPNWFRSLRDQCLATGAAFHFRKWGHWSPVAPAQPSRRKRYTFSNSDQSPTTMWAVGMHASGRELDGTTWNQVPRPNLL